MNSSESKNSDEDAGGGKNVAKICRRRRTGWLMSPTLNEPGRLAAEVCYRSN